MTQPATMPEDVHPINSVSVETPSGYKVFQLARGDITSVQTDLLICTSHPDEDQPLAGQIIERLRSRYGFDPDGNRRLLTLADGCWTCFEAGPVGAPFEHLLVLRMPEPTPDANGNLLFENAVRGVFAAGAALELLGYRFPVVSLPVVYMREMADRKAGVLTLIRWATQWLRQSDHTHTIQMVFNDESCMDEWDAAMNRSLGRAALAGGNNLVLDSLCQEVLQELTTRPDPRLERAAQQLREALANPSRLYVETLCTFGRKLIEVMLSHLLPRLELKQSGVLVDNIEALRKGPGVAPWIVSYMHTLRIFGNASVHAPGDPDLDRGPRLGINELISALTAIRSLLDFWHEFWSRPIGPEKR